ncbi:sensor histidine kinase [Streptosporangium sp. CA-135522]|uniref:sensor histidine kinase n=1 Tax=Streptosporangium sp. CA-135522 TaxID=3240072 RepID=UPI003D94D2F3
MDDLNMGVSLFLRRWSRGQLIALDALAGVAYAVVLLLASVPRPAMGAPLWAALLLSAATGVALAVRRLWPLLSFAVALGASLLSVLLDLVYDGFVGAAFVLYLVALTQPRRRWEPTVALGVCSASALLVLSMAGGPTPVWWTRLLGLLLGGAALLGLTWTVGRAVRERRAYAARSAEQLAGRAVTEERLRIARELHDVVAHSMSLIAVKAGIANHVAEARPEEARDALRVIEATSRGTLTEMRHLLGVMRTGTGTDAGTASDTTGGLRPAPGLADLPVLADRAAMAGVRTDLDITAATLPEGVELSVYRIVQEALTNVVRHAAPARCRVVVEADGEEVRVEVTDDGPGHRVLPGQPGHGLLGMRERAVMYGGTFSAGRRPEGGFGVSARLPYGGTGRPA